MKKILLISLLIILGISFYSSIFAQTIVTIGVGTQSNEQTYSPTPYGTYFKNFRQQYLVFASELYTGGGGPGNIYSIAFNVRNLYTCIAMPNYRIRIKSTTQNALNTTFEVGDYQQVYQADQYMPVLGWNIHEFNTPYHWDGASNLIVDIVTDLLPGNFTQNASVYYSNTAFNSCLRYQSDYNPAFTSPTGILSTSRANMQIGIENQPLDEPTLFVAPQEIEFGPHWKNTTHSRQFYIAQIGQGTLNVNNISLAGSSYFSLLNVPDMPLSMDYLQTQILAVQYAPTDFGDHEATITITDDTSRETLTIPLYGQCNDLNILYPNGGETWAYNTSETIRWTPLSEGQVEVSVSFDGGNNWTLASTVNATLGYYHFNVPAVNTSLCKVKVSSTLYPADYNDESDGLLSITTNSTYPKVILSYPSANNIHLEVGQQISISWIRTSVDEVALDYSTDDGLNWQEIATGISATSYNWQIPDIAGLNTRIRVRATSNPIIIDISDYPFTVSKLELLSPLGGETITADYSNGYTLLITWNSVGMTEVTIAYSSNGGTSWVYYAQVNAVYGFYYMPLLGVPSNNFKIMIRNSANTSISRSSETFVIRNPIRILNANGGGFITNSTYFTLRWLNQDVNPAWSVYWEYSLDNNSWTRIYSNASPVLAESLGWFVTTGLDTSVWLRAVKSYDNRIIAKSETSFAVTDKSLLLLEPNGGEEYSAFSTHTISWEASGCSSFNLQLSADNGITWSDIASNIPSAQGSYQWLVPDAPSVNCRIRLQDTSYTYMNIMSETCFSILPLEVVPPIVDFTADILTGDIPLVVQFTEDVNPGVGNVASRLWDFGDGNTSTEENPLHTYSLVGTYTVSLTVTNDFEGSSTCTKENYIEALPNTPRIDLLSGASLNFGTVYLGDTSPAQSVEVKNIGTAPLSITSFSFYEGSPQFAVLENTLPISVPVDGICVLQVQFIPTHGGNVADSLYINSDASNIPSLAVDLRGIGEYVPPDEVTGVEVAIAGNDAIVTWQAVTETIYGSPITPDCYIVLYNETPYTDSQYYYYLTYTPTLSATHHGVALFRDQMFYRVVAVKFDDRDRIAMLSGLRNSDNPMTWQEVKHILGTSQRP